MLHQTSTGPVTHAIPTAIALLLVFAGSGVRAQQATFAAHPPDIGVRRIVEDSMHIEMHMDMGDGGDAPDFAFETSRSVSRTDALLAVDSGRATKAAVTYTAADSKEITPFGSQPTDDKPVLERVYLLERGTGDWKVSAEDGKPVTQGEERFVKNDYGDIMGEGSMRDSLNGRAMSIGDSILIDMPSMNLAFRGTSSRNTGARCLLTLRDVRQFHGMRCALFDLRLEASHARSRVAVDLDVRGTCLVAIDGCWLLDMHLLGPMVVTGSQQGMTMTGKGAVRAALQATYVK
jgi:hypothetical protein